LKIALEEHFLVDQPGHFERWLDLLPSGVPATLTGPMGAKLTDVSDERLQTMDAAGVGVAVLSSAASVQGSGLEAAAALALARAANDGLAEVVRGRPDRYAGLASVPLQDPAAGADELERAVAELGLRGAMIYGHTDGVYLDDQRNSVLWERAEGVGVPLYLHASDGPSVSASYAGRPDLMGAVWSWTTETATHALRIVLGGVFDRFPGAQLILGHMGETLPFVLWRLDRHSIPGGRAADSERLAPSAVFRRNVLVTTAGVCADAALVCAISELGAGRVMFSIDHPFEDSLLASSWLDAAPLETDVYEAVAHRNARRHLRLD